MKQRIITAMGNPKLNDEFKKYFEVVLNDISYKEGIIEILEKDSNIDILFLSEFILEKNELIEYIDEIKKIAKNIKIIIFLEERDKVLENILASKKIYEIYINNEINVEDLVSNIQKNNSQEISELYKEIENLKKELVKKQEPKYKKIINKILKKKNNPKNNKEKKHDSNIKINILGRYNMENTVFAIYLAKYLSVQKKVKIITNNFEYIEEIYNVIISNDNNSKEYMIFPNIYITLNIEEDNKFSEIAIINIVDLKKEKIEEHQLLKTEKNFLLIEPNLNEVKYIKNNKIDGDKYFAKNKINIVLYNVNKNSISENLIKEIFKIKTKIYKFNILKEKSFLINNKGKGIRKKWGIKSILK